MPNKYLICFRTMIYVIENQVIVKLGEIVVRLQSFPRGSEAAGLGQDCVPQGCPDQIGITLIYHAFSGSHDHAAEHDVGGRLLAGPFEKKAYCGIFRQPEFIVAAIKESPGR
jgi:hypothetical protein